MLIDLRRFALFLALTIIGYAALAERMPQDNWYYVKTIGTNGPASDQINNATGLALSRSNQLYVADAGNNRIQVFDRDGNFLSRWGSSGSGNGQFNNPRAVCLGSNDQVYVCDFGNNRIQVFSPQGGYLSSWACAQPTGIAYSPRENLFYVSDNANKRIRVVSGEGTEVRVWGGAGTLPGEFGDIRGVAVGPGLDTPVYVGDSVRLQLFTKEGEFKRHYTIAQGGFSGSAVSGPYTAVDGTVIISENWLPGGGWFFWLSLFSPSITEVEHLGTQNNYAIYPFTAFAEGADGRCYFACFQWWLGRNGVDIYQRTHRTTQTGAIPRPLLISTKQRPGTTYVDVDYRIVDGDSTNVEVAAIALVDGTMSLNQVQMMKTFVEGTSTNLGMNIVANQDFHLTWNAGADWATNFGNIKICLLANDGRGLLDHLFLHIPANGANAALTIGRDPVTEMEMLNCWLWLLAKGDPAITLVSGQVKSGSTVLASGTTTTSAGRAFLFARMGVREATASELQYVREAGIPGVVHQWTPRYQVGPKRWPQVVNPWGFDTGNWGPSAWWVVRL